jgi:hypothetical protein
MIKGVSFRAFLRFLEEREPASVPATLARLEPELAGALRQGLVFTGNWYPLRWYRALHAAAQGATGCGLELAHDKGFAGVTADLSGIYRMFLAVVSPEFVIRRAAKLFSTYYDTGAMTVLASERGRARARWSECAGFDRNIWTDVFGGCEAALTAAGGRQVRVRVVSGGGDADETAEVQATWV